MVNTFGTSSSRSIFLFTLLMCFSSLCAALAQEKAPGKTNDSALRHPQLECKYVFNRPLMGKAKVCTTMLYTFNDSGSSKGKSLQRKIVTNYNNQGRFTESNTYSAEGKLIGKTAIKYDYRDSIQESNVFSTDNGLHAVRTFYKYDSAGGITELQYDPYPKLMRRVLHQFRPDGREIITNVRDANDSLVAKCMYDYDAKGNELSAIVTDKAGKVLLSRKRATDSRMPSGEGRSGDSNGTGKYFGIYKRDSLLTAFIESYADGSSIKLKERKDLHGNITVRTLDSFAPNGLLMKHEERMITYKYDATGNPIEEAAYNSEKKAEKQIQLKEFIYQYE